MFGSVAVFLIVEDGEMGGRKRGEISGQLLGLQQRFAAWRQKRGKGERIPGPLWKAATKLANRYGLCQTARVLKLDYYSLKKHCQQQEVEPSPPATFIELPSPPVVQTSQCVIEFENKSGHSMRVHLKGTSDPDLVALGRSFWGSN